VVEPGPVSVGEPPRPAVARLFAALLPAWVGDADWATLSGPRDLVDTSPHPEEEQLVAGAVGSRRAEVLTGRTLARAALAAVGVAPVAIGRRADRSPDWPTDVVGSITHTDGLCSVVVVQVGSSAAAGHVGDEPVTGGSVSGGSVSGGSVSGGSVSGGSVSGGSVSGGSATAGSGTRDATSRSAMTELVGVGLDAEVDGPLEPEVLDRVLTPAERDRLGVRARIDAVVVFSAKEAVFKAIHPATGAWLELGDVEVELLRDDDLGPGETDAGSVLVRSWSRPVPGLEPSDLRGRWCRFPPWVVAAVVATRSR
jgi:4'-phosphopantetheinyl transferase EntD